MLGLIAQGCSNQEIGEQLFISLHTVKTHARRINGKLGVARRTQAVARAKALGLLAERPQCRARLVGGASSPRRWPRRSCSVGSSLSKSARSRS